MEQPEESSPLVVVGLGASAGGLDALKGFFGHLPAGSDMLSMVVISHQRAGHKSLLPELLSRETTYPVVEIEDGMKIRPGFIQVAPPGYAVTILGDSFHLLDLESKSLNLPIDTFFRSLAESQKERSVGIVLSGTGSDGTVGLLAIQGESGMTMVQSPESAEYDGMPRAAIRAGAADIVLPVSELPKQLLEYLSVGRRSSLAENERDASLQKFFVLLQGHTGHDFSSYKTNTIHRRVERRMSLHRLADLKDYVRYLQKTPSELDALFQDLLIGVTSFFRDPEAFAALAEGPLRALLESKPEGEPIRVWVPGCSTGEEAYSITMLLREILQSLGKVREIQCFATDLNPRAIEVARSGIFPEGIAQDVDDGRRARCFIPLEGHYKVKKEIREQLVFATQDVISDPPFTKLDLVSCRNLLIYLNSPVQKKLLPLFHYALHPGGILFLGSSETIGASEDLFTTVDKKNRIFSRAGGAVRTEVQFPTASRRRRPSVARAVPEASDRAVGKDGETHELLLSALPPSVIADRNGEIAFVHGQTGHCLEPAIGNSTLNVIAMARDGLRDPLVAALQKADEQEEPVVTPEIRVKGRDAFHVVDLIVRKIPADWKLAGQFLVTFATPLPPRSAFEKAEDSAGPSVSAAGTRQLEGELVRTRGLLQTTVEELEGANEELKSTNEELQSTNEELQSTNEELETAKEETQSLNEELHTVNAELENKVEDMAKANDDLDNLFNATQVATLFLGEDLTIRRFTEPAEKLIKLIPSDVGRPISDQVSKLRGTDLVADVKEVFRTLLPKSSEVRSLDGAWYLMRITPYRSENVIEGVVVTFVDITALKDVRAAHRFADAIIQTVREPLLVLDAELRIVTCNRSFCETFQVTQEMLVNRFFFEVQDRSWDVPTLRKLLQEILRTGASLDDFQISRDFAGTARRLSLNARRLDQQVGSPEMILIAFRILDREEAA